jgi:hypothetical protein
MAHRTPEVDRVDFLSGEVHVIPSFAYALAKLHPERALLKDHFEASFQITLAKLEMSQASDQIVAGFQHVA